MTNNFIIMPNLKQINLSYNNLDTLAANDFMAFCSKIVNYSNIESINFSVNNLGDGKLAQLLVCWQNPSHITELNLSNNNLGALSKDIIEVLCIELMNVDSLKILNLADNAIGKNPEVALFFVEKYKYI